MRTAFLPCAPRLAPLVKGYLVVDDRDGTFADQAIRTCPEPSAILTVNLGKGTRDRFGRPHPATGLLGVQTTVRPWVPQDETYFVATFLTVPGLITLFPDLGKETADTLVSLDQLIGGKDAGRLSSGVPDSFNTGVIKAQMDSWLARRLDNRPSERIRHTAWRFETLITSGRIEAVAAAEGVSTRTLQRFFERHVGVCPRMLLNLDRMRRSVSEMQAEAPDRTSGFGGFADQSHQIRSWRRFVAQTPSAYRRAGISSLARRLAGQSRHAPDRPVFWL